MLGRDAERCERATTPVRRREAGGGERTRDEPPVRGRDTSGNARLRRRRRRALSWFATRMGRRSLPVGKYRPGDPRPSCRRPIGRRSMPSIACTTRPGGRARAPSTCSWFGHRTLKCPFDLWTYQEIIVDTRPDVIVESGTAFGGSALYLATVLDALGHGRILSIDTEKRGKLPAPSADRVRLRVVRRPRDPRPDPDGDEGRPDDGDPRLGSLAGARRGRAGGLPGTSSASAATSSSRTPTSTATPPGQSSVRAPGRHPGLPRHDRRHSRSTDRGSGSCSR